MLSQIEYCYLKEYIAGMDYARFRYFMKSIEKNPENITLEELEEATIESGNAELIFLLAKYMVGVNIDLLEEAMIKTKNAQYIYKFAHDIEGANIDALEQAMMKTGEEIYILQFKIYIKSRRKKETEHKKVLKR